MNSKLEAIDVCNAVIEDVTTNLEEIFREELISPDVLQELKALWISRLQEANIKASDAKENPIVPLVPVKITVPYNKSENCIEPRDIELMIPHTEAVNINFKSVFSANTIGVAANLSTELATEFLQKNINKYMKKRDIEEDGAKEDDGPIEIEETPQIDKGKDTSGSEDDASPECKTNTTDCVLVAEDTASDDEAPLNSDDDVTDEDAGDLFTSDNLIVCQYTKVMRVKNKWRLILKDGFMNLNGEDYVFQSGVGDAPW